MKANGAFPDDRGGAPAPFLAPAPTFNLTNGTLPILLVCAMIAFCAVGGWRVRGFMDANETRMEALEKSQVAMAATIGELRSSLDGVKITLGKLDDIRDDLRALKKKPPVGVRVTRSRRRV